MCKHCCAFVCAILALLYNTSASLPAINEPLTLPLIQFNDLKYIGAFRLPSGMANGDSFSIGGHPVAYNPAHNSLFIGSRIGRVAEVSIPAPVNSPNVGALHGLRTSRGFTNRPKDASTQVQSNGVSIDGAIVYGDAACTARRRIFLRREQRAALSHYSRLVRARSIQFHRLVAGVGTEKPASSRDSWRWCRPSGGAYLADRRLRASATFRSPGARHGDRRRSRSIPTHIGRSAVDRHTVCPYPNAHPTLGHWSGSNPVYGATAQVSVVALLAGTRRYLSTSDVTGSARPARQRHQRSGPAPARGVRRRVVVLRPVQQRQGSACVSLPVSDLGLRPE